jgi:MFS family permease
VDSLPFGVVIALIVVGSIAAVAYVIHAKRTPAPILDLSLLRLTTFRASVIGGFTFRLGIGALPFLLPLLLQIGFGLTPFQSGLITFTTAVGSFSMKAAVVSVLNRFGYRNVLLYNALISSAFLAACALFVPGVPYWAMVLVLLSGGFFRSLQFTSINTIAYAEIEPAKMSRATAMVAAAQQLSLSTGVAVGALVVEITLWVKQKTVMTAADFPLAFIVVSLIAASAVFIFMQLAPDAGAELSGRKKPAVQSGRDKTEDAET